MIGEKNWLIEYRFNGATYVTLMWGRTPSEAKRKLIVAGTYGIVQGEHQMTIPAVPGAGLLTRLICWWKSLLARARGK